MFLSLLLVKRYVMTWKYKNTMNGFILPFRLIIDVFLYGLSIISSVYSFYVCSSFIMDEPTRMKQSELRLSSGHNVDYNN